MTTVSNTTLFRALLLSASLFAGAAQAQAYMNVTVGGQFAPGVFGQVTVANAPPPPVINARPVIVGTVIQGAPVMYMHVPEHEQRHWNRYCDNYNACGRPVHFVQADENNRWWDDRRDHEDRRGREDGGRRDEYRHDNGEHRGRSEEHRRD